MICTQNHIQMKRLLIFFSLSIYAFTAKGQTPTSEIDELSGNYAYKSANAAPIYFRVYKQNKTLMLEVVGQGKTELKKVSAYKYIPDKVKPEAVMEFAKDASGKVIKFAWIQKDVPLNWVKIDSASLSYPGIYQLDSDPYKIFTVSKKGDSLTGQSTDGARLTLNARGNDHFTATKDGQEYSFQFKKAANGSVKELITAGRAPLEFMKVPSIITEHISNRQNGFTRCDSLQGMLTPLRTCYDVLFYDLNATIEPEQKYIKGNTGIRFKVLQSFNFMQIDLQPEMVIEKILYHNTELLYTRECKAVFIQFPMYLQQGAQEEIRIVYGGKPRVPNLAAEQGGFFWFSNRDKKMWIESVCQGVGASLWWPCKDHLSDRPDSMKISITIPTGSTEISNGKFMGKTDLPGHKTRFDWYVSYPITPYNVVVNIGDYAHFTDTYINKDKDTLPLSFYCMSYNTGIAKNIFSDTKRLLALYEQQFGKYPFYRDGFTLMESVYPMEHQGAISIGAINNPFNSTKYDSTDLMSTMWHETAHEWWGNSVGCSDFADMWTHEAFATYAEVLNYEATGGTPAAQKYLHSSAPKNNEPIIGIYNVNHFHMGDMYAKGGLMLHTLRSAMNNDSLFFAIWKGIQKDFRYKTVTTEDIVGYFNTISGNNYTAFFDQYLRYTNIPVLQVSIKKIGSQLRVQYKWKTDVAGLNLPVKVTGSNGSFVFIHPTDNWQTMDINGLSKKEFKVDTDNFYVGVEVL